MGISTLETLTHSPPCLPNLGQGLRTERILVESLQIAKIRDAPKSQSLSQEQCCGVRIPSSTILTVMYVQ